MNENLINYLREKLLHNKNPYSFTETSERIIFYPSLYLVRILLLMPDKILLLPLEF